MPNAVLDILIPFIRAEQAQTHRIEAEMDGKPLTLGGTGYLLGQLIRQYAIPPERQYISQAAWQLWHSLTDEDIWRYSYRNIVKCRSAVPVPIQEYRGNERTPKNTREIAAGETFVFRDVFHDEHMVPVSEIIQALIRLSPVTYESVSGVLSQLCICRILKTEDRSLYPKYHRALDREAAVQFYARQGIMVCNRNGTPITT